MIFLKIEVIKALTTPHTITTIQTFITGAAADGDVAAGVAGRSIALHTLHVILCTVAACLLLCFG